MARVVHGLGVSPGVAIGRVLLLTEPMPIVPAPVPPERVDEEVQRFDSARESARRELVALRSKVREALGEPYQGILDAQLLILDDPRLVVETKQRITVGRITTEWALKEVVAGFMRAFHRVEDPYLRERGGDLDDVHRRLQRVLRGVRHLPEGAAVGDLIVVAHNLGPSDAIALSEQTIHGLATDVGGRTSHTAILAQALSIPAVVGLREVTRQVKAGDRVVLDGDAGRVEISPDDDDVAAAESRRAAWLSRDREIVSTSDLPAVTLDGVEVTLRANIEFAQEVDAARRFGAQGTGLYRSEFLFLAHSPDLPTEDDHYRTYLTIGSRFAPHPSVIRSLDLGGEKYFQEVLDQDETNPVLGLRAIRLCLKRPEIFRTQIRGLLRAAAETELKLMIPLVTSVNEVRAVRGMLAEEAEALRSEGIRCNTDIEVGIMIEVPAAALAADLLAREVDFFSIGTNDLIQYALAVDRGNDSVNYLYQPLHPAVLRMVRFVVDAAREHRIPVSLCGEMAADPQMAPLLVGLGLRELSMQPRAIGPVRDAIRRTHAERARQVALESTELASSQEIEERLRAAETLGEERR